VLVSTPATLAFILSLPVSTLPRKSGRVKVLLPFPFPQGNTVRDELEVTFALLLSVSCPLLLAVTVVPAAKHEDSIEALMGVPSLILVGTVRVFTPLWQSTVELYVIATSSAEYVARETCWPAAHK